MKVKILRHVGIAVKEMEPMVTFYEGLGLKVIEDRKEDSGFILDLLRLAHPDLRTVKMETPDGSTLLELLYFRAHGRSRKCNACGKKTTVLISRQGTSHISFMVDKIDVKAVVNPEKTFRVAFIQDPEGNFVELVEKIEEESDRTSQP